MVVPFPLPSRSHPTCQTLRPRSSGSRKQDPRNGAAPVRVFIAVFCQHVVVQLHIYFYILLRHTWFLSVVEKQPGWVDAEGGRCGRWGQMAPDST